MPPVRRAIITGAPGWLQKRLLLRLGSQMVRNSYQGSRVVARMRRGTARIDVRASIFCTVREPVEHPLCGFYAAAYTRLLALFNLSHRWNRSTRFERLEQLIGGVVAYLTDRLF